MHRSILLAFVTCLAASCTSTEDRAAKPEVAAEQITGEPDDGDDGIDQEFEVDETLTLQQFNSWNRHTHFGADGERLEANLTLELSADGRARVSESGQRSQSNLDNEADHFEEIETRWRNEWAGTFERKDGKLILALKKASEQCVATESGRRGTAEYDNPAKCEPLADALDVQCESKKVTLEASPGDGPDQATEADAWACRVQPLHGRAGITPWPWIFGKDRCISSRSGKGTMRGGYEECVELPK